jgi:MFS family permease
MRMTPAERSATGWLASIFALRMLGLFMILPVLAVHAKGMPGGDDLTQVGLALGIYGLTQACLQIPMGWASDRWGRKPVILLGLVVFALGSVWAAYAPTVEQLVWARALQGAGAISSAVTAFLADLTRDHVRSKAMAAIGGSIGLTFALSLAAAPALYSVVGMSGLFLMTALLCAGAMWVVSRRLPAQTRLARSAPAGALPQSGTDVPAPHWKSVLFQPDLLRLNLGIFTLHLTQMALFVVMPLLLVKAGGLGVAEHWKVYLPVIVMSFLLMVPPMIWAEKKAKTKQVKLAAVLGMAVVQLSFAQVADQIWGLAGLLVAYFVCFNLLEAMLPSWVSRVAPPSAKGLALGVYNTTQALGLFVGGWLGGWVSKYHGTDRVFELIALLTMVWFVGILRLTPLPKRGVVAAAMPAQTRTAGI